MGRRLVQAQRLVRSERLDSAILDVKLNGADSPALVDDLIAQEIPVIPVTGCDVASLPPRFAETPRLPKPFNASALDRLAADRFVGNASPA